MLLNALDDAILVQKMDLVLRGMDVHVHILWSDLQAAAVREQQ